jgi:cytochrome P450
VRRYGKLIQEVTEREMESWPVGKPFALHPHTQRITLAVILRSVFGVHDEERLERASTLINEFTHKVHVIVQFPRLRGRFGRFGPWERFQRARAALDEFIYEEIAARRADPGREERDDVLSLLLGARHDDDTPMSDEELRDELITVIGAGHETTATALAWAMERLLRTPRVLGRLRESIAAGEDEYLDATVRETLRSRPVVADAARKMTQPARIGGYDLPAGTFVLAAIAAIHQRPDIYPDPEEFRPERFLDGKVDNYAWIPFGGGVRRCIGAAFAEYEMRIILRTILERADLSAPTQKPERVKVRHITMAPAKGAMVRLDRPLRPTPAQESAAIAA